MYRSLQDKAFYKKDSEKVHLWIHLLIKASFSKNKETLLGGKPYLCKPGEFTTGRRQLSQETGISESKIERVLFFFEKIEQQIEQRKTSTNRLIIIKNWELYQGSEQHFEQRPNNDRTTTEQRPNTSLERKNERRKEGKNKDLLLCQSETNHVDWETFKNSWNSIAIDVIKPIKEISDKRKDKIRTRFKEKKDFDAIFHECIEKIRGNDFFSGNNNKKWVISFDWIIDNNTNFIKVWEGKYDKRHIETQEEKEMREHEEAMAPYRRKADGY